MDVPVHRQPDSLAFHVRAFCTAVRRASWIRYSLRQCGSEVAECVRGPDSADQAAG